MKDRKSGDDGFHSQSGGDEKKQKKWQMKKNMKRLGGGGLSLEAFANAKSKNNSYNPALLKRKREFYKNAKHVGKYKKMLKQQGQPNDPSSSVQQTEENDSRGGNQINPRNKKKGKETYSLELLYEKKRKEEEKSRMEKEAVMKAMRKERESAEARRKGIREMMYKKTRKGQPLMKHRIQHILETLLASKT